MTIPDIIRSAAALAGAFASVSPHYARAIETARKADERASYLRRERPLAFDVAARVAVFSLGRWTERYPVAAYDLGEDAAIYIVDHLLAHATDSEDAMHEALETWQAEEMAAPLA